MSTKAPDFVILDFETTGMDPVASDVIEVSALLIKDFQIASEFTRLVKPPFEIPAFPPQISGITNDMVKGERGLIEIIPNLLNFLGDYPIVAHNASFERAVIRNHIEPNGLLQTRLYDSIDLIALVAPDLQSFSEDALRKWAGIDGGGAHRASKDTNDLFSILGFARSWVAVHRPMVSDIVNRVLGTGSKHPWWWSWFFDDQKDKVFENVLYIHRDGDLTNLEKEHDSKVNRAQATYVLRGTNNALRGELSKRKNGQFEIRNSQLRMAEEVALALGRGEKLAIEAPTGTGKSLAYMIPAIIDAMETKIPVVVATKTKELQRQLIEKDVPLAMDLLGNPDARFSIVKGQENYFCLRKLQNLIAGLEQDDPVEVRWATAYLISLASTSTSTKLPGLDQISFFIISKPHVKELIERAKSHHTTTVGKSCPFYDNCHFFGSAKLAYQSDVIVTNHALLFRWPMHLPTIRNLIIDEAHHLIDNLTERYALSVKSTDIADTLSLISKAYLFGKGKDTSRLARALEKASGKSFSVELRRLVAAVEFSLNDFGSTIETTLPRERRSSLFPEAVVLDSSSSGPDNSHLTEKAKILQETLVDLVNYLTVALKELGGTKDAGIYIDSLTSFRNRLNNFEQALKALNVAEKNRFRLVTWVNKFRAWETAVSPIELVQEGNNFVSQKRAVVMTSATLNTPTIPNFVIRYAGISLSREVAPLPSPFDLAKQAIAFVPHGIPKTKDDAKELVRCAKEIALCLRGKLLVICTANERVARIAGELRKELAPSVIQVFDTVSYRRATEQFKSNAESILVGSSALVGEGFDVPGPQLQCVILEKIDESMTMKPLAIARADACALKGAFEPQKFKMALRTTWLRQCAGRLIRTTSDSGWVIIMEARYPNWSNWSKDRIKEALAPIPVKELSLDEVIAFIKKAA